MFKASCPDSGLPFLSQSRRFSDVSRDATLTLTTATPSTDDFERLGTLIFSRDGTHARANSTTHGPEHVSLAEQALSRRCAGTQGRGVTVYVIDTGCETGHAELSGRATAVAAPGSRFRDGRDDHGHGTHAAARAVGRRVGVAGAASVVCIKALDERNRGTAGDVVAGLELATRMQRARGGWGVASVSLGVRVGKGYTMLDEAVGRARRGGLVVVAAAGNAGGDACEFSPARASAAVAVAAVGRGGKVARFSNRGACVDVFGPGVHVWSAGIGGRYARASGTSMAAPYVSGVVALLLGEGVGRVDKVVRKGGGSVAGACRWLQRRRKRRAMRNRWVRRVQERLAEIQEAW